MPRPAKKIARESLREAGSQSEEGEVQPIENNQALYAANAVRLSDIYNSIPDGWRDGQLADDTTLALLSPWLMTRWLMTRWLMTRWRITLPNNESAVVCIEGCVLKIREIISRAFPDYQLHQLLSFRRMRPNLSDAEARPQSPSLGKITTEALYQNNLNLGDNRPYTLADWCDNSETPLSSKNESGGKKPKPRVDRNPQNKFLNEVAFWTAILNIHFDGDGNLKSSEPVTNAELKGAGTRGKMSDIMGRVFKPLGVPAEYKPREKYIWWCKNLLSCDSSACFKFVNEKLNETAQGHREKNAAPTTLDRMDVNWRAREANRDAEIDDSSDD